MCVTRAVWLVLNKVDSGGPKLSLVSGLWVDSDYSLKRSFKETASSICRAKAAFVDFKTEAEDVRNEVNEWVEKETNALIKDLLPGGSLNELTRFVLANALYFKGSWEKYQFIPSETYDSKFFLPDEPPVRVPFMTLDNTIQYASCYDGFKVLQLPFKEDTTNDQSRFSMYIFLPDRNNELPELIEKVSSESGFLDRHPPTQRVEVGTFKIPKFKILYDFEASEVLKDSGLDLPFDSQEAELTAMLEMIPSSEDYDNLYVSKAFHKCFVEVDEEGTEATVAAAFDGVAESIGCGYDVVDFLADHPFMFVIRNNQNGGGVVHGACP